MRRAPSSHFAHRALARVWGRRIISGLFFLVLGGAGTASAEEPDGVVDLRRFEPPADPRASLGLEPATTTGPGQWNAGAVFSYAHRLVLLAPSLGGAEQAPIRHQASVDYLVGVGVGTRAYVSVALPTVAIQEGDRIVGASPVPRSAVGAPILGAKATLVTPEAHGGFALASRARLSLPGADARSGLSHGTTTGELGAVAELALPVLAVRSALGVRLRAGEREYHGAVIGHGVPWALGVALRSELLTALPVRTGPHHSGAGSALLRGEVHAELRGETALTPQVGTRATSPTTGALSTRIGVADVSLLGGVELPLDEALGAPGLRVVVGAAWAPGFYDHDDDGIPDARDACPDLAEDFDGFRDNDGCPDLDDDGDGVADGADECPREPEDQDEFADEDGCPDPDNDRDGVPDARDRCPTAAGLAAAAGCTFPDLDGDGLVDPRDWCPTSPEDHDGHEDEDGCPDLDDDGDGIPDAEDACPATHGARSAEPALHGCPNPDRDGDTFDDGVDRCPREPEHFDGQLDDDGCPEAGRERAPLVTVGGSEQEPVVRWRVAPRLVTEGGRTTLAPTTLPTLRALAQLANEHPRWVLLVGVRPRDLSAEAHQAALAQAFVLALAVRDLTHRPDAAEPVGWAAVATQPGAAAAGIGVGIVVVEPAARTSEEP